MLAYSAVFALAVRARPRGARALVGGARRGAARRRRRVRLRAADQGVPRRARLRTGYAHTYARLREPYGYWNAIGLAAALGAIGCLWLGARRAGHALLSALAYPAMGLVLVTLLLAYSRGALAALALGARAVVLPRAAAPARRRRAAHRCRSAPAWWSRGTSPTRAHHRQRAARSARRRRAPARGAARRGARRSHARRLRDRLSRPAGARPRPPTRRRAGAVLLSLLVLAVLAVAGRARGQPARPDRQHLAHRSARSPTPTPAARQRPRAPHRGRQRARALLERSAGGLLTPTRCSASAPKATKRPACATAQRSSTSAGPRLRRADARRPRPRRPAGGARAAWRVARRRGARHAPLQPALERLARGARSAGETEHP